MGTNGTRDENIRGGRLVGNSMIGRIATGPGRDTPAKDKINEKRKRRQAAIKGWKTRRANMAFKMEGIKKS